MHIAKLLRTRRVLLSLLVVGPALVSIGVFLLFYERTILSFSGTPNEVIRQDQKPKPTRIVIDDLEIDLPVEEGRIANGIWEISKKGASHLNISARPGEGGNIVIYGHNKKSIFGSLSFIRVGAIIEIANAEGKVFKYKVSQKTTIGPDNLDYVLPKNEEVLTVYTCTGFLDTLRSVVVAKPI